MYPDLYILLIKLVIISKPFSLMPCSSSAEMLTSLISKIYKAGYIPDDFRKSIFVPIPKVSRAQECNDFRTIALIAHASKILLQLIKRRITPIIERQLGETLQ